MTPEASIPPQRPTSKNQQPQNDRITNDPVLNRIEGMIWHGELLRLMPTVELDLNVPRLMKMAARLRHEVGTYSDLGKISMGGTLSAINRLEDRAARQESTQALPGRLPELAYDRMHEGVEKRATNLLGVKLLGDLPAAVRDDLYYMSLIAKRAELWHQLRRNPDISSRTSVYDTYLEMYKFGAFRIRFWDVETQDGKVEEKIVAHFPGPNGEDGNRRAACIVEGDTEVFYDHAWAQTCKAAQAIKPNAPQRSIL